MFSYMVNSVIGGNLSGLIAGSGLVYRGYKKRPVSGPLITFYCLVGLLVVRYEEEKYNHIYNKYIDTYSIDSIT